MKQAIAACVIICLRLVWLSVQLSSARHRRIVMLCVYIEIILSPNVITPFIAHNIWMEIKYRMERVCVRVCVIVQRYHFLVVSLFARWNKYKQFTDLLLFTRFTLCL